MMFGIGNRVIKLEFNELVDEGISTTTPTHYYLVYSFSFSKWCNKNAQQKFSLLIQISMCAAFLQFSK